MLTAFDVGDAVYLSAVAVAGLFLLWWRMRARVPGARLDRFGAEVGKYLGDWRVLALIAAVVYVGVTTYNLEAGLYACSRASGPSDALAYLSSGQAFLAGRDPFLVSNCGGTVSIPYGLSVVLVNAVGSLAGLPGVVYLWGAITVAVVPLTWWVADADRRYVTLVVTTSLLFLPLAVSQIDGASNVLVPVVVLVTLLVARRGGPLAGAVGGLLASGRFPTLFPTVGASGRFPRPFTSAVVAIVAFGAVTGATYLAYGRTFFDVVFTGEISRRSFSLNLYGVLLQQGWLPTTGDLVAAIQAVLTIALVVVVFFRARTALGAAAITLTGVALLSQFLSFNILAWLLPVALLGTRPQWWLWGIGVVGTIDYSLGYSWAALDLGVWWPYELMGVLLTVLLLGLFVDAWRADRAASRGADPPPAPGPTTS
jgi:hypothetical protein